MKKYTTWFSVLLFCAYVLPASAEYFNVNARNLVVSESPYVDVRAYGAALTEVPIQAALSAIDNAIGADVFIPRGTYTIGTGLVLQGKSNVTIRGAGKDVTILRMNLGTATKPAVFNADGNWGILSIESDAAFASPASNITIQDMTFWLDNTGTPGAIGDENGANGQYWIKNVFFRYAGNITFKNVKIRGSRWEALYSDGASGSAPSKVRVINSDFFDTQHNALNVNTGNASDVFVYGCLFDNTRFGAQVVGNRINISKNIFKDVGGAIIVAEASYPAAKNDTSDIIVSGNIITGLGANTTTTSNVYGISVSAGDSQFTDNTVDHGIIVSNNTVNNSVKKSTNAGPLVAFSLYGGHIKASNNHVSGITIESGASGDTVAYALGKGTASGIARQQMYFNNNTLDNTMFGDVWEYGVSIVGGDNSSYYFSGNVMTGISASAGFALYIPVASGTPYVSLNGDIFNGYIYYPGKWEDLSGPTYLNTAGALSNLPLFGDSNGAIGNMYSKNVLRKTFTDNDTTPSIMGSNVWQTANTGATSITAFSDYIDGQEITITFTDNNTTVVHGGDIHLNGSANFVATPYDTLKLMWAKGVGWVQTGGGVN